MTSLILASASPRRLALLAQIGVTPDAVSRFACPLCGGTRAVGSLALGRMADAVTYNPLALLILAAMLYGAGSYLFAVLPFRKRLQLEATKGQVRVLWAVVTLLFLANWAYVLVSGMHLVPMQHA